MVACPLSSPSDLGCPLLHHSISLLFPHSIQIFSNSIKIYPCFLTNHLISSVSLILLDSHSPRPQSTSLYTFCVSIYEFLVHSIHVNRFFLPFLVCDSF